MKASLLKVNSRRATSKIQTSDQVFCFHRQNFEALCQSDGNRKSRHCERERHVVLGVDRLMSARGWVRSLTRSKSVKSVLVFRHSAACSSMSVANRACGLEFSYPIPAPLRSCKLMPRKRGISCNAPLHFHLCYLSRLSEFQFKQCPDSRLVSSAS